MKQFCRNNWKQTLSPGFEAGGEKKLRPNCWPKGGQKSHAGLNVYAAGEHSDKWGQKNTDVSRSLVASSRVLKGDLCFGVELTHCPHRGLCGAVHRRICRLHCFLPLCFLFFEDTRSQKNSLPGQNREEPAMDFFLPWWHGHILRQQCRDSSGSNCPRVIHGAWDIIFTNGLATGVRNPGNLLEKAGCAKPPWRRFFLYHNTNT